MRNLLATLAITCGIAAGQSKDDVLTVLITGNNIPHFVLAAMEREVESALAPAALKLTWKSKQDRNGDLVVSGRMAIIHLRGQCVADPPVVAAGVRPSEGAQLGVTHISDGRILPIADVLCNAVRDFVSAALRGKPVHNRDELFGRALGRVLAHELYHILLQTAEHGPSGLSRWEQSSTDLLLPQVFFTPSEERRIGESAIDSLNVFAGDGGGR
jgi:hypothetical protein